MGGTGAAKDVCLRANARGRIRRARKRNDVLFSNVIKQLASGTANDRNCSWREDTSLNNIFHHAVGQPSRRGGWFHNNGNASKQRRSRLCAEPPRGKVKCIAENCGTRGGHTKMLSSKHVAL